MTVKIAILFFSVVCKGSVCYQCVPVSSNKSWWIQAMISLVKSSYPLAESWWRSPWLLCHVLVALTSTPTSTEKLQRMQLRAWSTLSLLSSYQWSHTPMAGAGMLPTRPIPWSGLCSVSVFYRAAPGFCVCSSALTSGSAAVGCAAEPIRLWDSLTFPVAALGVIPLFPLAAGWR